VVFREEIIPLDSAQQNELDGEDAVPCIATIPPPLPEYHNRTNET